MPKQTAKVTQAELERAIRALQANGMPVVRVVARPDGYAIETSPSLAPDAEVGVTKPKPVL